MQGPGRGDKRTLVLDNEAFREYYKSQAICKNDEEFRSMLAAFQTELPIAFWLCSGADLALGTADFYETLSIERVDQNNNSFTERPTRIPWLANAYTMESLYRREVRKNKAYEVLKSRLIDDCDRGGLVRQEVVSMLPAVFLGESESVLDMCAAPGSKTCQLLEAQLRSAAKSADASGSAGEGGCANACGEAAFGRMPAGCAVIANDVNIVRARLLSHRLAALNSPACATVCADASSFPTRFKFDAVLCDVPCSSDGTLRKNADMWRTWSVANGLQLHALQLKILLRALQVAKRRVVYSTCSLNPIENEAVVAHALSTFKHKFRLLNVPDHISTAMPGLTTWRVPKQQQFAKRFPSRKFFKKTDAPTTAATDAPTTAATHAPTTAATHAPTTAATHAPTTAATHAPTAAESAAVPEDTPAQAPADAAELYYQSFEQATEQSTAERVTPVLRSMFCEHIDDDIRNQLPCSGRFLPHRSSGGGFFIAVFEALPDVPAEEPALRPAHKEKAKAQITDDSFQVERACPSLLRDLATFYGLTNQFAHGAERHIPNAKALVPDSAPLSPVQSITFQQGQAADIYDDFPDSLPFFQKAGNPRRIHLATPKLHQIYQLAASMNFISFGVRVFERLDDRFTETSGCEYRLSSAGAVWLGAYMRRRIIWMTFEAMYQTLSVGAATKPFLLELERKGELCGLDTCRKTDASGQSLLESGGCLIVSSDGFETFRRGSAPGALGCVRVSALITGSGNLQPLLKTNKRLALAKLLCPRDRDNQ